MAPWALFASLLAWGWRTNLVHSVTWYGDVLEGAWAVTWLSDALRQGLNPFWYPLAYHPTGYFTVTYAWGPANFLLLLPLYWLGGAAFALNIATLFSFLLAFTGTYLLALRFMPRTGATVAALLFTFCGLRWLSVDGQLNVLLGSALLPWLILSLERGSAATGRGANTCYLLAGAIWAAAVYCTLYFSWIDGIAVAGWALGHLFGKNLDRRALVRGLALVIVVAGLLSLPYVVAFSRASNAVGTQFFSIFDVNTLGASANSLPIPYLEHPWLKEWIKRATGGGLSGEANSANLGALASLIALVGLASTWRRREWRPLLVLGGLGIMLALGITLHWSDRMVHAPLFAPLDRVIWFVGHALKPALFAGATPPNTFANAVPLPGLLISAVVPAFERARTFSRYGFLAAIAVSMLCGYVVTRVRPSWLRFLLAGLLIVEVVPPPTLSWPFPPPPHPAFAWLRQQSGAPAGMLSLSTTTGERLELGNGGSAIYATLYHGQKSVAGASSVAPGPTDYLSTWLVSHTHPFRDDEFMTLLGYYDLRWVALDLRGEWDDEALAEAKQNPRLRYINCFASGGLPIWNSPMCIFELLPAPQAAMNVLFRDGWSGAEPWGRWIDGMSAKALWIASAKQAQSVHFEGFPMCVPGQPQELRLEANGVLVGSYKWQNCDAGSGDFRIPENAVRVGPNELVLHAAYAARPVDLTNGTNQDPRKLSIGVTELRIENSPS